MAIVDCPEFEIGTNPNVISNDPGIWAFGNALLNATSDKMAFVFRCPKGGELHSFEWRTAAVANQPDNGIRLSFQDLDASGLPDGGADQFIVSPQPFSATSWQIPAGPLTDDGTGGGVRRTVAQGDWLAVVIEFASFVVSDSLTVAILENSVSYVYDQFCYTANAETGTYTKSAEGPVFALKYSDGTYAQFQLWNVPVSVVNTRTTNTGTTPDERGLRFRIPFGARIHGSRWKIDSDQPYDLILYDNADAVLMSISSIAANRVSTTPSNGTITFDVDIELTANTTYRLVVLPTTASSIVTYDFTIPSNVHLEAWPSGAEFYGTSRTNAGVWSDSDVTVPLVSLIFNGIDVSAGGGGEHSAVF